MAVNIQQVISEINTLLNNARPKVVTFNNAFAQHGTINPLTSDTPSTNSTYQIQAWVVITAITAGTITLTATYKDENGVSRTQTFSTSAVLNAVGAPLVSPITIYAQAGTAVSVISTFVGVSTTYDVGATLILLTS